MDLGISDMLRYEQIVLFKGVSMFSYIRWSILVINTGSTGPDLVNILEVPEIIQKVLESIKNH